MIQLVVFDFDGVFTNGLINFDDNGSIIKHYNVKDGTGFNLLKKKNIKVGVISGYKKNNSQEKICEHLKIEFVSFNNNCKLSTINEWCKQLNINLNNVAYMGDDINDIDCLKSVRLSGCPKNAINNCKNICHFVSTFNGGEGCIREFCDYILSIPDIKINTNIVQQIAEESKFILDSINIDKINTISKHILKTSISNNIFFIGIGKSYNIAKHTSNILNSVNVNCFLLDPISSTHGDIGTLKKNDLVILFSKSGNTKELVNLLPYIKKKECSTLGICCNNNSIFKVSCDDTFVLPFTEEIKYTNNINCIPSNSYMTFLYFTNILTEYIIVNSNLVLDSYKYNHPAGNIGENLKLIKDVLITEFPKIIIKQTITINYILLEMTKYKIGCCFFLDDNNILIGILTDGDLRRKLLEKKNDLNQISLDFINTDFYYETDLNKYVKDCKNIGYIPILKNRKILGIIKN